MEQRGRSPDRRTPVLREVVAAGAAMRGVWRGFVRAPHPWRAPPGAQAGLDATASSVEVRPGEVSLTFYDYGPDFLDVRRVDAADDLALSDPPTEAAVRWIDVVGLHPAVVHRLQGHLRFHTLAAEDVLHPSQRPRVEVFEGYLFFPLRMIRLVGDRVDSEQVAMFLFPGLVLTFQERSGDVWEPLRGRIQTAGTRVRSKGADYLAYALLDAVVDHTFPVLEQYGLRLEGLEASILQSPRPARLGEVQSIRRELGLLRRWLWPMRQAIESFGTNEVVPLKKVTRTFLRDVQGHADQSVDLADSYWDASGGLTDLYMSVASHRMNQVMKVLTILSAIFIPLTFLAGVYGMNLQRLPGSGSPRAFVYFVIACLGIAAGMLALFWRLGWFEREGD